MSLPYMPLYPSDFLADTSRLTSQQIGIYFRMIMLCWNRTRCNLPNDVDWIADHIVTRKDDEQSVLADIEIVINQFWTVKKGHLINPRLYSEWVKASEKHKSRKQAGKKGGLAKSLKNNEKKPSNASVLLKQPEPEPEPYINTHIQTRAPRSNLGGLPMQVYACWNAMAERNGLDPVRTDIPAFNRAKQIIRAVNDFCGGKPELLFEAIENIPRNPHWIGQTDAAFKARLDWFLSDPSRITQSLELIPQEAKNDKQRNHYAKPNSQADVADTRRRARANVLERIKANGMAEGL